MTSCNVTRDPNASFMEKAQGYYNGLRKNLGIEKGEDYKAWYFDPETLKGALFENENTSKYLGLLNLQNLTFSEVENTHFIDIPNFNFKINMDNLTFGFPDDFDLNDPVKILKQFPFVLIKNDEDFGYDDVYNKIDVLPNGTVALSESAQANNYSPDLFFINDFKYDVKKDNDIIHSLDYSDCSLAVLKRDIIGILEEKINEQVDSNNETKSAIKKQANFPLPIDIIKSLLKSYSKANKIAPGTNTLINKTLNIPGYFGTNPKTKEPYPVAIGPLAFDGLFKTQTVKQVENLKLNEGVKKIAFCSFDSSNLVDIEFPKTLEKIDFSAFSNIKTLKTLYFPYTEKPIDIFLSNESVNEFEIDPGEGIDPFKISIKESFYDSTIDKVIFENFNNKTLHNVNLHGFDKQGKSDVDCIEFVTSDKTHTFDTLKDAFAKTDVINTAFQINGNEVNNEGLELIDKDKTLILAHKKGNELNSLFKNIDQYHETQYKPSKRSETPEITFKLNKDLTLKGNIIVGGVTGREEIPGKNYYKEGAVVGKYAQIDLNGHKLVVDGGYLDVNGRIIDSSTSKTGSLEVKNNGIFKTNLVIKDSFNFKNYVAKLNNSDFPYHYYDFEDVEVPFTISNDSRLYAKETVTKNNIEIDTHTFLYAGKKQDKTIQASISEIEKEPVEIKTLPFIEFIDTNSSLSVSKNGFKTNLVLNGKINLNPIDLAYKGTLVSSNATKIMENMFFPLTSEILDVTIAENADVVANIRIKLLNDSNLNINENSKFTIKKPFLAYEENTNNAENILIPTFAKKAAKINLKGNLIINSTEPVPFGGHIVSNLTDEVLTLVNKKLKIGMTVPEGGLYSKDFSVSEGYYKVGTYFKSNIFVDSETSNLYSRENTKYYTKHSNVSDVEIKNVEDNSLISSKTSANSGNWVIKVNEELINTNKNGPFLSSYSHEDHGITTEYYLDETSGLWKSYVPNYDETTHTYIIDEAKDLRGIKISDEVIQGNLIGLNKKFFQKISGLQDKYFFDSDANAWRKVQLFEKGSIICYLKSGENASVNFDLSKYDSIDLFDGVERVNYSTSNFSYDRNTHVINANNVLKIVADNQILDVNEYIKDRGVYETIDEPHDKYVYAINKTDHSKDSFLKITSPDFDKTKAFIQVGAGESLGYYGYTSNGAWERGIMFTNENYENFDFFQLLDEHDLNRNFALLRNHDGIDTFDVFTKASGIRLNRRELDSGLADLLPDDKDYIGFRYIIIDGQRKAFIQYKDKQPTDGKSHKITEMVTISSDISFKDKSEFYHGEEDKITLMEALQMMTFNQNKVTYTMDCNECIAIGEATEENIANGTYLALAIYTDKTLQEVLNEFNSQAK